MSRKSASTKIQLLSDPGPSSFWRRSKLLPRLIERKA
jgi:hypothetical protein